VYAFLEYLEAHFWGSRGAGVLALASDTGKWLVALRSRNVSSPHTWGVIGGKIDDEDSNPQDAAMREFMEETGYHGAMMMQPAYIYQANNFKYHNFVALIVKDRWEPQLNWETEEFAWLTHEELLALNPKHFGLDALLKNSGAMLKKFYTQHQNQEGHENRSLNVESTCNFDAFLHHRNCLGGS
jgi:8-oxo-dGTP pyrophosphatase MutT (NUDIX family)